MRTLLMAVRVRDGERSESESVIVDTDGRELVLELDDGALLVFNKPELVRAVQLPAARHGEYPESMHDGSSSYVPPEERDAA